MVRLLALHGFGQNAELFVQKRAKDRSSSFQLELLRKLKSVASVVAIDAPHTLPYDPSLRGWWIYDKDLWDGTAESIQSLAEHLLQRSTFEPEWSKGGYDAILGFSQGAILAAALCTRLLEKGQPPRFAIFLSGFGKPTPEGHHIVPQKAADVNIILSFIEMINGQPKATSNGTITKTGRHETPAGCSLGIPCDELVVSLRRYHRRKMRSTGAACAASAAPYAMEELTPPGPGTYERLVALLVGKDYASMSHGPCRTSEDAVRVRLAGGWQELQWWQNVADDVTLHSGAKAMLLRTPPGEWLLAVLPADAKLSWKKLRSIHGKGTRIATEEEVLDVTGCFPGAVPPIAAAFPGQAVGVAVLADVTLPEVLSNRQSDKSHPAFEPNDESLLAFA
eukprot:s467_g9.t1